MIGKHEVKLARQTQLKESVAIGLDDVFAALQECLYDLTDEQVTAFPIPGRNNIAWIAAHVLDNMAHYANSFPTGKMPAACEGRTEVWPSRTDKAPEPGDAFPSTGEILRVLKEVHEAALAALSTMTESELLGYPRHCEDYWEGRTQADAYMRTIWHAVAHLRQIWLLRGALGLTDGISWPQQHWA